MDNSNFPISPCFKSCKDHMFRNNTEKYMTVLFMCCQVLPPFLLSEPFSWLNMVLLTVSMAENLTDGE